MSRKKVVAVAVLGSLGIAVGMACGGSSSTPTPTGQTDASADANDVLDSAVLDSSIADAGADAAQRTLRGAYADPDNPDGGGDPGGETMVEALEAQVGPIDIVLGYHPFDIAFPKADEQAALDHGRTLIVSLGCGDTNQNMVDGAQDTQLNALVTAMKATGKPIVLRWFWEMNLDKADNNRTKCFDPAYDGLGAQAPGFFDPAHYIAAWKHIHAAVVTAGATNVRMFFCPAGGASATAAQYYPGDSDVEINGFDVYDRTSSGLKATLAPPYAAAIAASKTRPIWVGETGATAQLGYLDGTTHAMLAANYPLVDAINYFDAVGSAANWSFDADGIAGFTAFGK